MSTIDEIKDRIDIVSLVSETVKLRKSGKNYTGFCPFHPNTRTPAFVVFPESGTWRCFGACNEGGDIFSFVMKKEGWDFAEAARNLAARAGVELRPKTAAEEEAEEAHQRLREVMESAIAFYRHNLMEAPTGKPVLDYLHQRGLQDASLESFEIGYAPAGWDATLAILRDKGYSEEELLNAGMVSEREGGGVYDRFRNRIMIPIRDVRGRIAGFGARVVDPQDVPKFLNSPQTVLFDKGRLLYGLDKARKSIRSADQAVVVEGYMDVIALHQAGFANAVSPMGTALTEAQLRLLKRYSRNIVLALDADAAGNKATMRGLTLAREALEREMDPVFDSRGLVRHEGRLDADLRIVRLPEGKDPDEVVAEEPTQWEELLRGAQTVVDYVMDVWAEGQDLEDPKIKAQMARSLLPLIEDVADHVEREAYRQSLARRLQVDERALLGARVQRRRRQVRPGAEGTMDSGPTTRATSEVVERFCLGVLLQNPELLYRIDRTLQELELERLSMQDFAASEGRVLFQLLRQALSQEESEPGLFWRSRLDEAMQEQAEALLAVVPEMDFGRPRIMEGVVDSFLRLRKRNLETALAHLRFQLQAAQEEEEDERARGARMQELTKELRRLALQKDRLEATTRRREVQQRTKAAEAS
jgi:DNA primase